MKTFLTAATVSALALGTLMAGAPAAEAAPVRTISGTVWNDANANDKRDKREGVLANREVVLLNAKGKIVGRTKTNKAGSYTLRTSAVGTYRLRTTAKGYTHTTIAGANKKTTAAVKGSFYATVSVKKATKRVNAPIGVYKAPAKKAAPKAPTKKVATNQTVPARPNEAQELTRSLEAIQAYRRDAGLPALKVKADLATSAEAIINSGDPTKGLNDWFNATQLYTTAGGGFTSTLGVGNYAASLSGNATMRRLVSDADMTSVGLGFSKGGNFVYVLVAG